jgi:hypothetical protein
MGPTPSTKLVNAWDMRQLQPRRRTLRALFAHRTKDSITVRGILFQRAGHVRQTAAAAAVPAALAGHAAALLLRRIDSRPPGVTMHLTRDLNGVCARAAITGCTGIFNCVFMLILIAYCRTAFLQLHGCAARL